MSKDKLKFGSQQLGITFSMLMNDEILVLRINHSLNFVSFFLAFFSELIFTLKIKKELHDKNIINIRHFKDRKKNRTRNFGTWSLQE